jgi:hypothetical protein
MPARVFPDNPLPARYLALACPFITKKNVETFYSDVEIRAQKKPTGESAFSNHATDWLHYSSRFTFRSSMI